MINVDLEVHYRENPTVKESSKLEEREGPRINVGRHCLLIEDNQQSATEVQIV